MYGAKVLAKVWAVLQQCNTQADTPPQLFKFNKSSIEFNLVKYILQSTTDSVGSLGTSTSSYCIGTSSALLAARTSRIIKNMNS